MAPNCAFPKEYLHTSGHSWQSPMTPSCSSRFRGLIAVKLPHEDDIGFRVYGLGFRVARGKLLWLRCMSRSVMIGVGGGPVATASRGDPASPVRHAGEGSGFRV